MSLIGSFVASPNFDVRQRAITMLVLHYTGMKDGESALRRLCEPEAAVSAHYLVWEDGRITSLVDEEMRAWHAGVACWRGVSDVNSVSVGIEIVNGGHDFGLPDFPAAQVEAVIALAGDIVSRHAITAPNVVGHSDIAPVRKQDPGEKFPWAALAEAGLGLWPSATSAIAEPSLSAARHDLARIGYHPQGDTVGIVTAFQRRWRPSALTGRLDGETAGLIRAVAELSG